jgi:hypothetical protein
MGPLTK